MNNYYTLIYLNKELNKNILHGEFLFSVSPHKNVLECYIETGEKVKRLILSTNPAETVLFLDDYRPPKKQNVIHFFEELEGCFVTDIELAENDRLLTIQFGNKFSLLFKLYGNDVNVLLVKGGVVVDAFKHPESVKGNQAPKPQSPAFAQEINREAKPKNQITKLNPLLPRNLLKPIIRQHNVDEMDTEQVKSFVSHITQILKNDAEPRVLRNGKLCLWPENILALPTEKKFDSVNAAIRFAYRNASHLRRLNQKKEHVHRLLERNIKKKKAQLQQLQNADKSLQRAEKYEKYGHLLMAHVHEKTLESDVMKIPDFYEKNTPITIPVKTELTIAENAERYYVKAKAARTSYKKARQRIPETQTQKEEIKKLIEELHAINRLPELEKWINKKREALIEWGYGGEDEGKAASPYRKFMAGKYEIWIGKNARSNDKLTALAHKEDIWLHARGVGGSHVVIRMGNQKEYPPKQVILKAASFAAYYSKAKGTKTAPVSYTKRKYIHKPKGASPGAVVMNREQVVMVPPVKPGY